MWGLILGPPLYVSNGPESYSLPIHSLLSFYLIPVHISGESMWSQTTILSQLIDV